MELIDAQPALPVTIFLSNLQLKIIPIHNHILKSLLKHSMLNFKILSNRWFRDVILIIFNLYIYLQWYYHSLLSNSINTLFCIINFRYPHHLGQVVASAFHRNWQLNILYHKIKVFQVYITLSN